MTKYWVAEYRYGANLATFDGELINKSYRMEAGLEDVFGSVYHDNRIAILRITRGMNVFTSLQEAVAYLVGRCKEKKRSLFDEMADLDADIQKLETL